MSRGMFGQVSDTLSAITPTARRSRTHAALYVGLAGDAPHTSPARIGLDGIYRVEIARGGCRSVTRPEHAAVVVTLADPRLSSRHARLTRLGTSWVVEDLQSKNGTTLDGRAITRHT